MEKLSYNKTSMYRTCMDPGAGGDTGRTAAVEQLEPGPVSLWSTRRMGGAFDRWTAHDFLESRDA